MSMQGWLLAREVALVHTINEKSLVAFVFSYYHETLLQSDRARCFLAGIGFNDPSLIQHLYLGFSYRTLGLQLPVAKTAMGQPYGAC